MVRNLIIGAGLSGLSTAMNLSENSLIIEKNDKIGGLAQSYSIDGYTFDIAGHFLHIKNLQIKQLLNSLLETKFSLIKRSAWIYLKEILTKYPFQSNFFGHDVDLVTECLLGLIKAKTSSKSDIRTFEDWIYKNFGEGIAKYFMIPYNTKLWSVHPSEMTTDWLSRFIPKVDLEEAIRGALSDLSSCEKGYNPNFFYPKKGGIQALAEHLKKYVKCEIDLKEEVALIDFKKKQITTENGEIIDYENLISTMPLDELVSKSEKAKNTKILRAANFLKYNQVVLINLGINETFPENISWVYIPETKYSFYRLGSYSFASKAMAPPGKSSIFIEVSLSQNQIANFAAIKDNILKDLLSIKFLSSKEVIEIMDMRLIKPAYIIYDTNRSKSVKLIDDYLIKNDVYSIGRYGKWIYSSMEDSITQGIELGTRLSLNDYSK